MEAHDYAEDVFNPGNAAWFDFLVKSELDDTPPSPGLGLHPLGVPRPGRHRGVRGERAARRLPLAPTRFLESDPPEGGYFLALNLYNGGGGMIVGGARAEWDVFVQRPDGADPNAGVRPRLHGRRRRRGGGVGQRRRPADPGRAGLAPARRRRRARAACGASTATEVPVFESSFPVPDPATDEVARFTREMAIGNDYIYWAHGVSDRVLYNATTYNHDAYLVDPAADHRHRQLPLGAVPEAHRRSTPRTT